MQSKFYNRYKITHKNGDAEEINAVNLVEALNNMEITEEFSPVLQTYMEEEGIRTLVADMPAEVPFTAVVAEGSGGSIATPVSGVIHAGDQIALKAIPARNYEFVNWKMNDSIISDQESLVYTMPELHGEASAVFKATFRLADVEWTTAVDPDGATGAGVVAFPASGSTPANEALSLIAVEAEGYTFDHWERNGQTLSDNKILNTTVEPLAENETACIYVAVFNAV